MISGNDPNSHSLQEKGPVTDKKNYEVAVQNCLTLRNKLHASIEERESLMKTISTLKEELNLQETHFKKETANKEKEFKELSENFVGKDSEIMK